MEDNAKQPFFRQQALEYYFQSREQSILPRLAKPRVFLLLWILLVFTSTAVFMACFEQIPVYVSGSGVITEQRPLQNRELVLPAIALVVVPIIPSHISQIPIGAPVRVQIGTQGQSFMTTVDVVELGILSPDEIQQRYQPGPGLAALITDPSIVILIKLVPPFTSPMYTGSLLSVQIQVGSTSVFSSFFGSAR